jgi:ABC-type dipeptide/oligopeptide/nickel transport system permease component
MPAFWLGILLLYLFAFVLPIFPLGGYSAAGVVLPAVALGAGLAGGYFRILDGNLREALSQPFIQVALAKGLSERRAVIVHALRNAVLPLWSMVSLDLAGLLGGVTLTETVFHWPGLGRLAVEAVFNQDLPVLMGVVLVTTVLLVAVNTLAEIVYALIDPRFRSA